MGDSLDVVSAAGGCLSGEYDTRVQSDARIPAALSVICDAASATNSASR